MLAKLEAIYLNILRGVILAAATLALLLVVLGGVKALPLVYGPLGIEKGPPPVSAPDLRTFIAEKRVQGVAPEQAAGGTDSAQAPDVSPVLKDAAALLNGYAKSRMGEDLDQSKIEGIFQNNQDSVSSDYQPAYAESLKSLMQQLSVSKGQALPLDKVNELLSWHLDRFKAAATEAEAKSAARKGASLQALAVSAGSLLTFLLVVFCFLFVKIERNLRLVHVVDEARPAPTATSGA